MIAALRLWWQDRSRMIQRTICGLGVVVLGVLGYLVWDWHVHCAPGVDQVGAQCVGITDGTQGPLFGAPTADALRLIGEENTRLTATGTPSLTVAYLVPIPPPGVEDEYGERLAGDLRGVAVAQRQANRTNTLGDRPAIRVLVANVGDSAEPAEKPVRKLIEMATSGFAEHRLMAVGVTGKSLDPYLRLIGQLVLADVPVIVSHVTADRLLQAPSANTPYIRVAPSTAAQAEAAAAYLRQSTRRALVVQNSDPDDQYARTLGDAFRARYPDPGSGHTLVVPEESYNGSRPGAANAMKGIVRNLCQQRPDVVFFAGRSPELAAFVAALPSRPCPGHPVRVMTGDDGVRFGSGVTGSPELAAGLRANATVEYTALAHPRAWPAAPAAFAPGATAYLTGHCPECLDTLFPGARLDDSYTIMAYDMMMAAVAGIRSPNGVVDSPGALTQEFKRMHGAGSVAGASGWISLTSAGETIDKAVAIMRVLPMEGMEFVQLSAPSGVPCTPNSNNC
ncbi:hypothetical protein GCM10023321_03440 [Pseudonocardia eucalypti]|uniref:ABC transporter substrate-binding protein n=1 Tax=Pseudonocardia eucalypti TaxID=648755 RepID=A0ABP9PEZ1_9PSEU|nr:ABC-type branched-subunit amino acid transport system substrate-binding protein [Pseudonocardia eucalypti]